MITKSLEQYIKENNIKPGTIFTPTESVYAYKRVLGDDWHSYPDPDVKFSEQDEWIFDSDTFDGYWFGLVNNKINRQNPEHIDDRVLKIEIVGKTVIDRLGFRGKTQHFKILEEVTEYIKS